MPDLDAPGVAKLVAKRIKDEIDAYCVRAYSDEYRSHLGASLIGRECPRELWYTFRWVGAPPKDGRLYRLFNRGHREEERFIEWLRGIGFTVETHDENGKQFRVAGVSDHFGGSRDGAALFPALWEIAQNKVLLEFKTSGTGRKFTDVATEGVAVHKQDHYGQMSVYGRKSGITHAIYMIINKNDDDLHVEVVKLDWKLADQLEARAQHIIAAVEPPERISESRTFFKCKFCDYLGICHDGGTAAKNCRSCTFARPAENARWFCTGFNDVIPEDFVKTGCDHWKSIA